MDLKMMALVEKSQWYKGKPEPRPHRNIEEELLIWQLRSIKIGNGSISSKSSSSSIDAHCCKTPFEELKPIFLKEMEVPKIHFGKYLVCKVVGKPITFTGVHNLIQDLNGDVEEVAFYNFCWDLKNVDWISVGTIFVIKEPRLQYSQTKTAFLRIDSPSDAIFVDPCDEKQLDKIGARQWYESLSKDAEVWKKEANEFFKNARYQKALFFYDRGIRCDPDMAVLHLNKALACLKNGAYYDAYESAKLGLEKGGNKEKALYRMGRSAYGMRQWQKAAKHFAEVLKENPENSDATKELKRAMARLTEEKTGKFDFKAMYVESKKDKPVMDVADYTGPIEIANIPGKGRGIIASKDISKGTLLCVSKSIGSGYSRDFHTTVYAANTTIKYDAVTVTQLLQVMDTIKTIKSNPQKAKEIYDLYAGDTFKKEEIPEGVIDVARLEIICALNRFGSDVKDTNYFDHLFIIPSYFNHSCIANAVKMYNGDVMIIRASTTIKKGEEIYLPYISPLLEYSIRKESLASWSFTCECKLCELDAKDEFCTKRHQLLEEFKEFAERNINSPKMVVEKGEEIVKKIRETYVNRQEYKIVLAQMLNLMYPIYCAINPEKRVKYMEELITLVDDCSSYAINCIGRVYFLLSPLSVIYGNKSIVEADEMMQKAQELRFCIDREHLKMLYPLRPAI